MRFELIKNKELIAIVLKAIQAEKFVYVDGMTGGDNDILCIDSLNKQFCWCEHGSNIASIDFLLQFQYEERSFKLRDLVQKNMECLSWFFD